MVAQTKLLGVRMALEMLFRNQRASGRSGLWLPHARKDLRLERNGFLIDDVHVGTSAVGFRSISPLSRMNEADPNAESQHIHGFQTV